MPEIKHTFTAGKMNKDLDERLVQNGEYRDALNIQVRTTSGDPSTGDANSGAVQNLKGNNNIGAAYTNTNTKVVAGVADEKTDKAYFFFAAPAMETTPSLITTDTIHIDSIIEQDIDGTTSPVVVDIWGITQPKANVFGNGYVFPENDFIELEVEDASNYRVGMIVEPLDSDGNVLFSAKIEEILITSAAAQNDVLQVYNPIEGGLNVENVIAVRFTAEKVLNFDPDNLITGINIIDDLLFWTDNRTEPKKVNITRCKAGCAEGDSALNTHTKLMLMDTQTNTLVTPSVLESNSSLNDDLLERHITVIRKAPKTAPTLEMSRSGREGNVEAYISGFAWLSWEEDGNEDYLEAGEDAIISQQSSFANTNWREGDILVFTNIGVEEDGSTQPMEIICKFITYEEDDSDGDPSSIPTTRIRVEILFDQAPSPALTNWFVTLKQRRPLFETKFPRFGYRYKYEDGEYSSFSPWSEIAFLPGAYDYKVQKGHNLGMENDIRELTVKDFIPYKSRDIDVVAVDILYKTTDSPNVYVVKTVTRGIDGEWELFTPNEDNEFEALSGELTITSEMVHKVLPQNQTLRSWDNVPRYALAQEIISNRLVYGNYTQGYTLPIPVGLRQSISSMKLGSSIYPEKSIKSIRDYKIGMVFGDKYGRETPVVEYGYITGDSNNRKSLTGGVNVEKQFAHFKNTFSVTQDWSIGDVVNGEPPTWTDYVKYYVKETSSEYYNLVMDRWYYADDILRQDDARHKNVWISFNSADRNKVDEETYLILKSKHGQDIPVVEKARYKILAIENQAPTFIKTELRDLGRIDGLENTNDEENSNIFDSEGVSPDDWSSDSPNTESPERLMTKQDARISLSKWNNIFGPTVEGPEGIIGNVMITDAGGISGNRPIKGRMRIRIRCYGGTNFPKTLFTSWRTLTHYTTAGESMKIHWDKVWGDEANMAQRFEESFSDLDNYGSRSLTYIMEFKEEVVQNKPEFEGRFFVKIENDPESVLEDNVLINAEQSFEYFPISTHQISYIDTQTTNPAQQGPHIGEVSDPFGDSTWWGSAFDNIDITDTEDPWGDCGSVEGYAQGELEEDIDWTSYETIEDGFATCLWRLQTRNFWQQYDYSTDSGQGAGEAAETLFIDAAHAYSSGGFTSGSNPDDMGDLSTTGNRYKPTGLDQGGAANGTLGRMVISHTKMHDQDLKNYSSSAWTFWNEMKKPGTYFWFLDDTSGPGEMPNVYKTVPVGGGNDYVNTAFSEGQMYNFANIDNIDQLYSGGSCNCENCDDGNSSANGCTRRSVRIEFRRVNSTSGTSGYGEIMQEEGGEPLDLGIDPTEFDPRGHVHHDGRDKMKIQILGKFYEGGGQFVPQNNAAVWETEPKESVDLDLYYEASNAIPMRLNIDNAFNYIPINSSIKIKRRNQTNSVFKEIPLSGVLNRVTNIIPSDTKQILEIKSTDSVIWENESLHTTDIIIGDTIEFIHPNGLITRSKITNYYKKQSGEIVSDAAELEAIVGSGSDSSSGIGYDEDGLPAFPSDFYDTLIPQTPTVVEIKKMDVYGTTVVVVGPFDNTQVEGEAIGSSLEVGGLTGEGEAVAGNGTSAWFEVPIGITINSISFNTVPTIAGAPSLYQLTLNDDEWMTIDTVYEVKNIISTGYYEIDNDVWKYSVTLGWHNCYSFGNGVESDRIRDDFNAPQIDNGVRVSSTFSGYKEEKIKSGMIYSGLYNSKSEVNDLNEFNMAEKITKNLNPSYGSIQALKTRDTDVVVLAEDKVLKVLSSKDAVYNADGNPQLVSTNRVLGTAVPFVGDYGISQNPESLAWDQYRLYFTDKQRGAVLRLSQDGLTPISNIGMKTWFRENLRTSNTILGTFDIVNGEYNLTLDNPVTTISFNEAGKGWVSFKSFIPEVGTSVSGKYITAKDYRIWEHYSSDVSYNNFYGSQYESSIDVLFNDLPSSIKSFGSINYEGSQAKVNQYTQSTVTDAAGNTLTDLTDGEYYNLTAKTGWYVDEFITDLGKGTVSEFIDKENKWFNKINGEASSLSNLDTGEFTTQGLGTPSTVGDIYF